MKKLLVPLCLALIMGASSLCFTAAKADAAGYPMTCVIGSMNGYNILFGYGVPFTRSSGPASAGLQPGQCAFEDRAVRASEPTMICTAGPAYPFAIMAVQNGKIAVQSDGSPAGNLVATAIGGPTKTMNFTVDDPNTIFGHVCFKILKYGV